MPSRRHILSTALATAAGLTWLARHASAASNSTEPLSTRAIPSTGEKIPAIGMGTSGSFEVGTSASERDPLREVLKRFFAGGGKLIDTAPSYGSAEDVLGELLREAGLTPKVFLATKLSSFGREAGLAQFKKSLARLQMGKVDLLQVHNLRDWRTQFDLAKELKAQGKVRYTGITHYVESAHEEIAEVMQAVKPDFVQINYSVISRNAEKRVFPLARDLGVAVLANRTFEDGQLFSQIGDKPLPQWAAKAGITSWAQAFLKFALSHPAVTAVIPATSKPERQSDNLKAGVGPALTEEQRRALIAQFA
jgi:aryl-alcohol dehydrogenase-like predicted oxidoreductase